MAEQSMQLWELWYPGAGATGLLVARARIDPADVVWVHAAPETMSVTVRTTDDELVAKGSELARDEKRYPMTRLWRLGSDIHREDRWPNDGDLGATVILPGGEAAILKSWWNADDESEWRWQVEFYNHV